MPRLSIVEVAPFAAISSVAVRASDGSRATRAGRNNVEQTPTADPAAKTMMRSSIAAPAAETTSADAPRSTVPSRNRSRRKRSPRDDANGAMAAAGSRRMRPATPTAVDPPWLYANTPSATKCAHSAHTHAPQASSARRMSAFRAATRREANAWMRRDTWRVNPTGDSGGPRISDARSTRYACRPLIAEEPSCPAVVQSRAPS